MDGVAAHLAVGVALLRGARPALAILEAQRELAATREGGEIYVCSVCHLLGADENALLCSVCGERAVEPTDPLHANCAYYTAECDACGDLVCDSCVSEYASCTICKFNTLCNDCDHTLDCDVCGKRVCEHHVARCVGPENERVCDDCASSCGGCAGRICQNCSMTCSGCGAVLCSGCVRVCCACGADICDSCTVECGACVDSDLVCGDCTTPCRVCHIHACDAHIQACDECFDNVCDDDVRECGDCDAKYCHDCDHTCGE